MILEALHTKLNAVLSAYPLIGDVEAEIPFCTFMAEPTPIRMKSGISEYENRVRIKVISDDAKEVNEYTTGVMAAIESISGTIENTVFNHVIFMGESGIYHNEPDDVFMNDIEYKIFTSNR